MPELPEVETTCRVLRKHIIGRELIKTIVREPRLRWKITKDISSLKKVIINSIDRRAKYILIHTSQGTLIIHLGMSGRLSIIPKVLLPQKHDHVDFILDNETLIRYTDHRRFGSIHWTNKNAHDHPLLLNLGPEPFSKKI